MRTREIYENSIIEKRYKNLEGFFEDGFSLTSDDRFGKFRLEYSPWIRALCGWFEEPATDWIYLIQGSQTCKTTFLMGTLLYISQFVSGAVPCLWVQSTEDEAKQFISERLRLFLDESGKDAIKEKRWKQEAFRVHNAPVKVGYATAIATLRTKPARYIFGDECGIWKIPISYVKKRTRTFAGRRKGFFSTTPPFEGTHFSWKDATSCNFYQWWLPCPACGEFQTLKFANIKFEGKQPDGAWDYDQVKQTAYYECEHCGNHIKEKQKLELINRGKLVCVDPNTYRLVPEKACDSKTLQISSLYSIFTSWGELAVEFIKAKHAGIEALKIFYTDELAESPREFGESFKETDLSKYIDLARPSRRSIPGVDLITIGVDVQRKGELYFCVIAWKSGTIPSGHILEYGRIPWKNAQGDAEWNDLTTVVGQYENVCSVALDSSDGFVTRDIYDFVNWAGAPYLAIKDSSSQNVPVQYSSLEIDPITKNRMAFGQKIMLVHSAMIKDDIATAFKRNLGSPGAWSFPADTSEEFLKHLTNEHRTTEKRGIKTISVWKPKYSNAPQHWFSALVYGTAAMYEYKGYLQERRQESVAKKRENEVESKRWINVEGWKI